MLGKFDLKQLLVEVLEVLEQMIRMRLLIIMKGSVQLPLEQVKQELLVIALAVCFSKILPILDLQMYLLRLL